VPRSLVLLRVLALWLAGAAALMLGAALLSDAPLGFGVLALGLGVAALSCWRLAGNLSAGVHESNAWGQVSRLRATLAERDAVWSAFPAPAAAWDSNGQRLMVNDAWQRLGLPSEAPPTQAEVSVGEPPRQFVVETAVTAGRSRIVVLREVTRERLALQAKDELLATVGHELRTPLSSIKGYGQLMARQLASVQEQVQRVDQLIEDVLDSARTQAGFLTLRRAPIAVNELVGAACERFGAGHPDRTLEVALDARCLIEGDAARLNQVLDNLLSNAAKYSPSDTPISVKSTHDSQCVRVSVTDRGVGIAREHIPHLFERFYRVPAPDGSTPAGLGLGLSIVRDLVEAHGGWVEVESEGPGTGCTFTIVLPVALPLGNEPEQPALAAGT